jgi:hypothetical protein
VKKLNPALRNTCRLLALTYALVLGVVVTAATAKYWIPAGSGLAGIILLLPGFLILSFAFALAAIGWSLWSLRAGATSVSSRSLVAFGVSLLTAVLIGAYLLILSGVIRIKR